MRRVRSRTYQPPPPPPNNPDAALIKDALQRLANAYGTELTSEVVKVWPHISKQQKDTLERQVFRNLKALQVQFEPCNTPNITGDTATISCTQRMSYTAQNQRSTMTPAVNITLKKVGGAWQVENLQGQN